jgi:mRNA interferase YafQ
MYSLNFTSRFKKDVKLMKRRGYDMNLLKECIITLEGVGELSKEYQPHKLSGNFQDYWEAHLKSDWLILWKVYPEEKEIWLTRTGTHSDLF